MSYKFEFYCGMTCYGGSEQKECPCDSPRDCELRSHPDYEAQAALAKKRMMNVIRREMREAKKPALN